MAILSHARLHAEEGEAQPPVTLAVMNFTNRAPGDGWDWLEKGLADMLITDLDASGKFQVVSRERMQEMFDEMALGELGVLDARTTQKAGKVLRVDWAVFGSFMRQAGKIEVECHIVEVATQKLRRVEWVRGPEASVLELEKELALKVVGNFGLPLTEQERASLLAMRTKLVDAAAHFYTALDYIDHRDEIQALVEFRGAVKQDPHHCGARFWIAKVYRELGEFGHARVELKKLLIMKEELELQFYNRVVLALGYVLELEGKNAEAVNFYMGVAREQLVELETLKAAGKEVPKQGAIGRLRNKADELIIKEYQRTGTLIKPDYGVITLSVDKPTYGDDFSTEKRFWDAIRVDWNDLAARFWPGDEHALTTEYVSNGNPEESYIRSLYWHPWYIFKAQEGYVIEALTVEMTGMVHTRPKEPFRTNPVFGCQIWSLARTRDFTRFPFHSRYSTGPSAFYDMTNATRTFTLTFHEGQDAIRAHMWLADATLFDWKVTAKLSPKPAGPEKVGTLAVTTEPVSMYIRLDDEELLRGRAPLVMENIPVGTHVVSGKGRGSTYRVIKETGEVYRVRADHTVGPEEVEIREGERTELVLHVQEKAYDERGGSKLKEMQWNKAVTSPRSLRIEAMDLMQDQTGTFWLVWSWGRVRREDRDDYDLWIASSPDGTTWSKPRKLPLNTEGDEIDPQLLQRNDGKYWLAWIREGETLVSSSEDTVSWSPPMKLMEGLRPMSLGGFEPLIFFNETASGELYLTGKRGTNLLAVTSRDGKDWSQPKPVFDLKGQNRFVFKACCLTQDSGGLFYLMWCACPDESNDRRVFLARSDSHEGLTWSRPPAQTPLPKIKLSRREGYWSPVTGTGDPLLLVDRTGAYHVFSRSNGFYHSMSIDGHTWTPWQMISTAGWEEGISMPRALAALQDKDGVFWLAIKANQIVPGDVNEKGGDIWLGRVKRFDQWGLVSE